MERAYQMETPTGTLLTVYVESDRPFVTDVLPRYAQSELPIDRDFIRGVEEVHGVDTSQPPPGEPPEVVGEWADENVSTRKRGLAFCVPLKPGTSDQARSFFREAYERRAKEMTASCRAAGISRELVALNHTPMGDVACVYLEADDPVASSRHFAESRDPFDVWFKDQVRSIAPPEADPDQPLPPITEVFDSEAILVAH